MSGEPTVIVDADQIVVVSDTVPPPGVQDVADALAQTRAARDQAQAVLTDPSFVAVAGVTDQINTLAPHGGELAALAPHADEMAQLAPHTDALAALGPHAPALDPLALRTDELDALGSRTLELDALGSRTGAIDALSLRTTQLDDLGSRSAEIDVLAAGQANIDTVAGNIDSVNTAATNILAIQQAPAQAASAATSASQALAIYGDTATMNAAVASSQTNADTATAQAGLAQTYAASAASVVQQDLSAVTGAALHRSPNAIVAMFLYDVSKDTDGGAWVDRVGETSWMLEALNGSWLGACASEAAARAVTGAATGSYFQLTTDGKFYKLNAGAGTTQVYRGNTAKFPRLAAIVAEASNVTIYDLTQPGRPMWMQFSMSGIIGSNSGLAAVNGIVAVSNNDSSSFGIHLADFLRDSLQVYYSSGNKRSVGGIAQRPRVIGDWATQFPGAYSGGALVSAAVNAVAMTVLPDAPVDPFTGLQVPTIAVATNGGVSVIKHDGNVYNSSQTAATVDCKINGYYLYLSNQSGVSVLARYIDLRTIAAGWTPTSFPAYTGSINEISVVPQGGVVASRQTLGPLYGIDLTQLNPSNPAASLKAGIAPYYNTGWMTGDIRRCWLSSNVAESITATELVTNGTFNTDLSGWTVTQQGTSTVAWSAATAAITGDGTNSGYLSQQLTTVAGKQYAITFTNTNNITAVRVGSTTLGLDVMAAFNPGSVGTNTVYFTATGAASWLTFSRQSIGTANVDNVSVKEVIADRSYKNRPLSIYGTIAKTLTGGLSMYSGWSATNYAQEAYSSDLDFGTGAWSVSTWANIPATLTPSMFTAGPELTTNGNFAAGNTGWTTVNGTLDTSSGQAVITNSGAVEGAISNGPILSAGKYYRVSVNSVAASGGARGVAILGTSRYSLSTGVTTFIALCASSATFQIGTNSATAGYSITVDDVSVELLGDALIFDRSAVAGAYYRVGINPGGCFFAEAYDGTTTRRVTSPAAYNTAANVKARAEYSTSGTLALKVNGQPVASTTGAPLLTLSNASAVTTIGNARTLDAAFPGSIALVKASATTPTQEQSAFMYEQEKFLWTGPCTLPDAGAVVSIGYGRMQDKLMVVSAANRSFWTGLSRTSVTPVTAGSYTQCATESGVDLMARITTNPGVDVSIPAYGLREELFNRAERAARLARLTQCLDYVGGFTATTVNGSTALTNVAGLSIPSTVNPRGIPVSGSGITAGAVITDVVGTTVYIDKPATAGASGVQVTLGAVPLPTGYELADLFVDGALRTEGSTNHFTRSYDGFVEREVPVGAGWSYNSKIHANARRAAA
jgi:hypothetical protein